MRPNCRSVSMSAAACGAAPTAHDHRQIAELRDAVRRDDRAVAVDENETPFLLPDGEGLELRDRDAKRVGQAAHDAHVFHPVDGEETLARRFRVEREQRIAARNAKGLDDRRLVRAMPPVQRYVVDLKPGFAQTLGDRDACRIDEARRMTAREKSIDARRREQREHDRRQRASAACSPRIR